MSDRAARKLAFALDYPTLSAAQEGARLVVGSVGVVKIGLELFIQEGPSAVQMASELGFSIFLDLKLHDIPQTVERAVGSAASRGVRYLTIHAGGGPEMMKAAVREAEKTPELTVLAVTVLTSLSDQDLAATGIAESAPQRALRLAELARDCGLGGLVCSALEVEAIRERVGPDMTLCTPGIRPSGAARGDQKRVATPESAIAAGSDLLVVGRPIRDAADPQQAAREIHDQVARVCS